MARTALAEAVRHLCRREGLLPARGPLVIGFSGGPDSLALLDVLASLGRARGLPIAALHVDHGLREGSAAEAERARRLSEGLGVPMVVARLGGLEGGGNIEERAREGRRAALQNHAAALGAGAIALGHTADDQAETVLLRLLRGAGSRGLAAMAARQPPWVRPLLTSRRADVEAHLRDRGLEPVLDPSNRSPAFLRNRVRQRLLPLLEDENPRIVEALSRLAATAREESEALDVWARQLFSRWVVGGALQVEPLAELPVGVVHRLLGLLFAEAKGDLRRLQRNHLEALAGLCRRPGGAAQLDLPGCVARREYGLLRIAAGGSPRGAQSIQPIEIKGPGSFRLVDGVQLEARLCRAGADEPLALPLRRVELPLLVRGTASGDRLCIERIGRRRHRRVARILIDAKIPVSERNSTPLVLSRESEVLLVVGVRRAAGLRCRPGEAVLRFDVEHDSSR